MAAEKNSGSRLDVSRLNKKRKGTFKFEKEDLDRIERKYKLSDVGNVQVIDLVIDRKNISRCYKDKTI